MPSIKLFHRRSSWPSTFNGTLPCRQEDDDPETRRPWPERAIRASRARTPSDKSALSDKQLGIPFSEIAPIAFILTRDTIGGTIKGDDDIESSSRKRETSEWQVVKNDQFTISVKYYRRNDRLYFLNI